MKTFVKVSLIAIFPFIFESFASEKSQVEIVKSIESVKPIENEDPIDYELRKCIKKWALAGGRPLGEEVNCQYEANKSWEKEVDIIYQKIIKNKKLLNVKDYYNKKSLNINKIIEAQKAWKKFYDIEVKAFEVILSPLFRALMQELDNQLHIGRMVKARAEQLREYLQQIDEY